MAKVVLAPREEDIKQAIEVAKQRDERVSIDPDQLSILTYGFFRYKEACGELERAGLRHGGAERFVAQICVLLGEHNALKYMVQAGFVPRGSYDELVVLLDRWRQWALAHIHGHEMLDPGFCSTRTHEELRDQISEERGRLEGAQRRDEAEVKELKAQLDPWQIWAMRLAPKCTSDQEMRDAIEARWKSG